MASLDYEWNNQAVHLELNLDTEYGIGRDPACPISLPDRTKISRRHCVICFNTTVNAFTLADLYSTNGTFLNGRKISQQDVPLQDGDRIAVGPVTFVFHSGIPAADREIPPLRGTGTPPAIPRTEPFAAGGTPETAAFRFRKNECPVGDERILEPLTCSRSAELYLTRPDGTDEKLHLLKILRDPPQDPAAGKELKKTVSRIPQITGFLPVIRCGELDRGICYWITEYQEMPSYARMISMLSPLPQTRSLDLICSAAMILARGRQNGWYHGNLKPTKILYAPQTGNHLVEMGLSAWRERFFPDLVKRPEQWYAAPETSAGKSVWQSDQYALGIMFFQMLTGILPFYADTPEELAAGHREKTMPLPQERNPRIQTEPAVNAILVRMTMKDPSQRYDSWEALLSDLEKVNSALKRKEKESGIS